MVLKHLDLRVINLLPLPFSKYRKLNHVMSWLVFKITNLPGASRLGDIEETVNNPRLATVSVHTRIIPLKLSQPSSLQPHCYETELSCSGVTLLLSYLANYIGWLVTSTSDWWCYMNIAQLEASPTMPVFAFYFFAICIKCIINRVNVCILIYLFIYSFTIT